MKLLLNSNVSEKTGASKRKIMYKKEMPCPVEIKESPMVCVIKQHYKKI